MADIARKADYVRRAPTAATLATGLVAPRRCRRPCGAARPIGSWCPLGCARRSGALTGPAKKSPRRRPSNTSPRRARSNNGSLANDCGDPPRWLPRRAAAQSRNRLMSPQAPWWRVISCRNLPSGRLLAGMLMSSVNVRAVSPRAQGYDYA
jgi:hypothetical protein